MKWLQYGNKKLKHGTVFVTLQDSGLQFHIVQLLVKKRNTVKIVTKLLDDCYFNEHFGAYRVHDIESFSLIVLEISSLEIARTKCIQNCYIHSFFIKLHY